MKEDQNIARIYDLIEIYDFYDLSENDREFVLKNISLEEYTSIRTTIIDTKKLFSGYPEEQVKYKYNKFKKLATYPVEIYKIAAAIILITSALLLFNRWDNTNHHNLLASVDTVFVKKTDTVLVYVGDTAIHIKESASYKETPGIPNKRKYTNPIKENAFNRRDCSKELCPEDIQKLNEFKARNDFSEDKILTDFIVSIN